MRIAFAALGALLALSAQAQIYKWTDEKGRPRYGERPPPGVEARLFAPAPGAPQKGPGSSVDEQEVEFRRRHIERQQAEERAALVARQRAAQCAQMREELGYAEQFRLLRWENGERVLIPDAERARHADRLRALIRESCP